LTVKTTLAACLVTLLGLALLAPAPAAAPPAPEWLPRAEQLIRQLGDRDYRAREEAERRLHAMGVKIVPALRRALGSRNAEVRRRARVLIPALESAHLFAPKRVTLAVEKKPLRFVLDAITKQTGYKIMALGGPGGAGEKLYTLRLEGVTFWEAIDTVCKAGGMVVQQSWGDDQVRLAYQGAPGRFVGHDGPFRTAALNFAMHRTVDLSVAPGVAARPAGGPFGPFGPAGPGPGGRSESLTFNFLVFAEPRLPFVAVGDPFVEAAYDNERNSLLGGPDGFGARFGGPRFGGGGRQLSWQTQVQLHRPSLSASTVKVMRGTVPVTLLIDQKAVLVTDKALEAKGKKVKAAGMEFRFDEVTKQAAGQYQFKIHITNSDSSNPGDMSWTNTIYQRLELHDAKGNKYNAWGTSWHSSGPNFVQITFTFSTAGRAGMGAPERFLFQSWTTRQHHVAFEFRDMPLP
jgi:hypothetical protein